MSTATTLVVINPDSASSTKVKYDFSVMFEGLAERGEADAVSVSTEEGFSPLGASRNFFDQVQCGGENSLARPATAPRSGRAHIGQILPAA